MSVERVVDDLHELDAIHAHIREQIRALWPDYRRSVRTGYEGIAAYERTFLLMLFDIRRAGRKARRAGRRVRSCDEPDGIDFFRVTCLCLLLSLPVWAGIGWLVWRWMQP